MSNAIFPTLAGRGWDLVQRPRFNTNIQSAVTGSETRVAYMSYPVYDMTLVYNFLRAAAGYAELQNIFDFFLARQGAFDNFLFSNWWDNQATLQSFGTGDGTTVAFQLKRSLKDSGFLEPVMNLNGAPAIQDNGSTVNPANYSVGATGVVTFTTAPVNAHALTWTGAYYYRCRFKDDLQDYKNFMNQVWDLKKCDLIGSLGNKI